MVTVLESIDQAVEAFHFEIEVTSWGFADTGTRFGRFPQPAAASTFEEKIHDAGLVHKLTGASPSMGIHVQWDLADDDRPRDVAALSAAHGVRVGSINPNVFQDPCHCCPANGRMSFFNL
jgi:L-rhamnose isomerase/sugar isomerase